MSQGSGSEVVIVKLGGSLITDKRRPETARPEVIERLSQEIAAARPRMAAGLIVGHGSGSFGHVAAARAGLGGGPFCSPDQIAPPDRLHGAGETQHQAAVLHQTVAGTLLAAGVAPFSWSPSSALEGRAGRPVRGTVDALERTLGLGFVPVIYGDVMVDLEWGVSICSTEAAVSYLVGRLRRRGYAVRRSIWCGETDGIYGADGQTLDRIHPGNLRQARRAVGGSAGTDVTGGMRLRLDTAWQLARQGVESWIVDGTRPGLLHDALLSRPVPGTRVARV